MPTQNGLGCPAFLEKSAAYGWREGQGKGDVSIPVAPFIQGGLSSPRGQRCQAPVEVLYREIKYWGHVLGVSWLLWEISI